MKNLGDSKNLTKEELEIERLDLEIKKREIEQKELELRKKELMFKRSGEVGVGKERTSEEINRIKMKEELELRRNGYKLEEAHKPKGIDLEKSLEKVSSNVENNGGSEGIPVKKKSSDEIVKGENDKFFKNLKRGIKLLVIPLTISICLITFKSIKENREYYESIPFILNPEDYYGKSFFDVIEVYGDPFDPNNEYYAGEISGAVSYAYDMGDYNLRFRFEHGILSWISYDPDGGYSYKNNPKDALYLFGLEDKQGFFVKDAYRFRTYKSNGYIYLTQMYLHELKEETKTSESVVIYFPKQYMEREVFESDVSEVELVYDLEDCLGMSVSTLYDVFGSGLEKKDDDEFGYYDYKYETPLGTIKFDFRLANIVEVVRFEPNSPMNYKESPQEVMIMFGVEPDTKGIYLVNYWMGDGYFGENYKNIDGKGSEIFINDIDLENKTFKQVNFFIDKEN